MKNGTRQLIGLFVVIGVVGCDAPTSTAALEPEDRGRREREALAERHAAEQRQLERRVEDLRREVADLLRSAREGSERLSQLEADGRQLTLSRLDDLQRFRALHGYVIRTQCDAFVAAQTTCRHGQWVNEACSRRFKVPRACTHIGANYPRFPAWAYTDWEPVQGYAIPGR